MTDEELEKQARTEYEAARERDDPAWSELPEVRPDLWRDLIRGAAGVALD